MNIKFNGKNKVGDNGIHQRVSEAALRGLQAGGRELEEASSLIGGDASEGSRAPRPCPQVGGERNRRTGVEMTEFINDYQRRHYEACMRAQENSRKLHLSSAEMRSIVHAHREMVRASRLDERTTK